jgi:hypothetical protein
VNQQTPLAHKSTVVSPLASPFIPRFQAVSLPEQSNLSGIPTTQSTSTTTTPSTTSQVVPSPSPLPPSASAISQYTVLIQVLNGLAKPFDGFVGLNDIASSRWGKFWAVSGKKLSKYLQAAAQEKVIALRGENMKIEASLHPSLRVASTSQKAQTTPSTSKPSTSQRKAVKSPVEQRAKFQGLIQAIRELAPNSTDYVDLSAVATRLKKVKNGGYESAGFKKMKPFAEAAQALGLVILKTNGTQNEIRLRV